MLDDAVQIVCSNVVDEEFPPCVHPSTFPQADDMRGRANANPAALDQ